MRTIIFSLRNHQNETGSMSHSKSVKADVLGRIQSTPWRPISRTALGLLGELVTGALEWVLGLSSQLYGLLLPVSSPVFPLVNVGYNTPCHIGLIQMANKHKVINKHWYLVQSYSYGACLGVNTSCILRTLYKTKSNWKFSAPGPFVWLESTLRVCPGSWDHKVWDAQPGYWVIRWKEI